ncbi:MAG: hypothetical protein QG602_374 [Verrucomicrobiota bacterium]|nr:hypothetical protein [Verrucomicrobiota bacterium]
MPPVFQRWLPFALLALVLGGALGLRIWDLDRRPMHADEANQAVKAGQLLGGRGYKFDPADHHGPTLYYAVLPIAGLRGESTLAELSETTVRLVPALAGTLAVLLLYLLALPLGRWPALAAAGFLAVSPSVVYYSRYFIQESLLLTFTLGALLAASQWWRTGKLGWVIGAGICAGLMQATKASVPLFFLAALAGLAVARPARPVSTRLARDIATALIAALFVAALFYSSFGTNLRGLSDALTTYASFGGRLTAETGHEKPWWYYLTLLGWQVNGGVFTHQIVFSFLALVGFVLAFRQGGTSWLRWVSGFSLVVLVGLSLPTYKTPWHVVHLAPGMALLAAGVLSRLDRQPLVAATIALVVLSSLVQQVGLTSIERAADERNPYAYVHTSTDIRKAPLLAELASAQFPGQPIRVISEEVWPLPWYLRDLPNVGYWPTVPEDCDGALIIASAGLSEQVQSRLRGNYTSSFVGLRPGFVLVVFKRQP